jgi:hypothetical protein
MPDDASTEASTIEEARPSQSARGGDGAEAIPLTTLKEFVVDFSNYDRGAPNWAEVMEAVVDPNPDAPSWTPETSPAFLGEVRTRKRRLRVDEVARRELREEAAEQVGPPASVSGTDFLAESDEPVVHIIEGLWPVQGNVLLVAADKCGKSTASMCLVRSLADGDPFLGHFAVNRPLQPGETVMLLDLEMSRQRVRSEMRAQGVRNLDRVRVETLRGELARLDLNSDAVCRRWVEHLAEQGVRTWIVDPIAPLLAYLGVDENDNTGVGQVLAKLDAIKKAAGVSEMLVSHHAGHSAEWRPRGASRFKDWPDAMWGLIRETPEGEPVTNGDPRFFAARGRVVDEPLRQLVLSEDKRLTYRADTTRAAARRNTLRDSIAVLLACQPGLAGTNVYKALVESGTKVNDKGDVLNELKLMESVGLAHGHRTGTGKTSPVYWYQAADPCPRCAS